MRRRPVDPITYAEAAHILGVDPSTVRRAADVLGVNVARLNQLVAKGFLPFEVHVDGTRMYRREQLATVANGRQSRWH